MREGVERLARFKREAEIFPALRGIPCDERRVGQRHDRRRSTRAAATAARGAPARATMPTRPRPAPSRTCARARRQRALRRDRRRCAARAADRAPPQPTAQAPTRPCTRRRATLRRVRVWFAESTRNSSIALTPARVFDESSHAARPTAIAAIPSHSTNGRRTNPVPPPSERPSAISQATIGG